MKRTLYVLAIGVFGIATTELGVIGILPQLAAAFHVSIDKAGWLLSSFAIVIAVCGPFMTLLFSWLDKRKTMLFVLALFTISNIVSAMAVSFNVLLLARILPAFMHPVFWSVALATAAGSVPQTESPKAVGIVFGGFTIASVLGIPVVSFIAALYGWQASFVMCAAVNTLSLLGLLLWLPAFPVTEKTTYGKQLLILKKPVLWINFVLACLIVAAMYASYGYLAAYLRDITKMNGKEVSLMLMIFGFTGIAGNWLAGKMLSRNIAATTIIFIALLSLSHIVVFYAGAYYIPMVIVIFLWGFIHTGGFLISNINVTTAASEAPEFVNSIFTTCGNLAVTIGSVVGGAVIAHVGLRQVVWSSVVLLVLSTPVWALAQYRSRVKS